ncbi:MAG: hypothetical protein ACREHG_04305 [Candidatus Saccharimonadales bacterium]
MTDESITVTIPDDPTDTPKRPRAETGTCKGCGTALSDKRRAWCDSCRPSNAPTTAKRARTTRLSSGDVKAGMDSFAAKIFVLLTIVIAWSQLRARKIPDPNGTLVDRMAFTDTESVAFARPIARMFLSTDIGRRVAPTLVQNEDVIDAAFALWDWYQRNAEILDSLSTNRSVPPMNGNKPSNEAATAQTNQVDYIPPAPQTIGMI